MNIRKSVKIFAGVSLALCLGMFFSDTLYSYYADVVQSIGLLNFLSNGQTSVVVGTNSSGALTVQQSLSTTAAETAIISVSTPTATNPLFAITQSGHFLVNTSTAIPTAGANCAVDAGSSDTHGKVVISGGATAACTITFAAGFTNTPDCFSVNQSTMGANAYVMTAPTKTTVVLTLSGARNDTISWFCLGR